MKHQHAKDCIRYLGEQFPGRLTQGMAKLLLRQFTSFERDAVMKAIDAFTLNHEFKSADIEPKHLLEAIRAEERKTNPPGDNARKEGSWFDAWRRMRPQLGGAGDVEVCLRVHRQWLIEAGETYREKFLASCRNTLFAAGMLVHDDRRRYAETITLDPDSFRQVLQDVRDNQPSLEPVGAA